MFTHLHVHTEYSLLDGMCRIPHLVQRAKEMGMESLAITDHGNLYGAIAFYQAAREAGIKPIIGCEIYVALGGRYGRSAADRDNYHLTLLAKNEVGYRNLVRLVTKAHLEGYYYRPRVDRELLVGYHEGIIALSGCRNSEIARCLAEGRLEDARAVANWHCEVFGDYFLELQRHDIPELAVINTGLMELSRELGIPLVATNDLHYVDPADAPIHDLLLCIQTNSSISDEKRMRMPGGGYYLKSPQEMAELFADIPEAVSNTDYVASLCNLNLEFNRLSLPVPKRFQGRDPDELLKEACWQGVRQLYPTLPAEVVQRLAYELEVVRQTQFANYFLVVWDIVSFAKERGILYGVRGSAAGSIILYCLGITTIDPLAHRLVFERFLNLERREMPDIDLDFADDRREEVINYVAESYGRDHMAQIITFGTLGAKAVVRDVGRSLGMSYSDVDRVARLIPAALHMSLDRALEESTELVMLYEADDAVRQLVDTARRLEGIARHASTHAAGVVISSDPLADYVPLQRPARGDESSAPMTQFAMEDIAQIGLMKMDLLGLANLTILGRAQELIAQRQGITLDLQNLPLDDTKTFAMLSAGETTGVFQLEGAGMRHYIRELKPTSVVDIAAMIALYRPGPMQHIPTFIRAKHGLEPIRYPHPALADILSETYGVIVYQDQVLLIAQAFAGYSLGEADLMRKAMGKKVPAIMRAERTRFIEGAVAKGYPLGLAQDVFNIIEPFAGYAFNKAHSVCYAMIGYQTAYLKANYPAEYMTAMFNVGIDSPERVAVAVAECHRLGIPILPPDINRSDSLFTIEEAPDQQGSPMEGIRFGLAAVKNVGLGGVRPILEARGTEGPFTSLEDLCRRVALKGVNRRVLESLIKAGALDSLGPRGVHLASLDRSLKWAQQEHRRQESGQATLFDLWGQSTAEPLPSEQRQEAEVPIKEKLAWERELLGVYVSQHPFAQAARPLAQRVTAFCGQVTEELVAQGVVIAGVVTAGRRLFTKDRRPFLIATLEDLDGSVEVAAFPEVYEATRALWQEGNIVVIEGRVRMRGERPSVVCDTAYLFQGEADGQPEATAKPEEKADSAVSSSDPSPRPRSRRRAVAESQAPYNAADSDPSQLLRILVPQTGDSEEELAKVKEIIGILKGHPGRDRVRLMVARGDLTMQLDLPELTTAYGPKLQERLRSLVGEAGFFLEAISD